MKNEFELKIKALYLSKIKEVFNDEIDIFDRHRKIKDLLENCDQMVEISREIESNEPYVKVVEKLEEAENE